MTDGLPGCTCLWLPLPITSPPPSSTLPSLPTPPHPPLRCSHARPASGQHPRLWREAGAGAAGGAGVHLRWTGALGRGVWVLVGVGWGAGAQNLPRPGAMPRSWVTLRDGSAPTFQNKTPVAPPPCAGPGPASGHPGAPLRARADGADRPGGGCRQAGVSLTLSACLPARPPARPLPASLPACLPASLRLRAAFGAKVDQPAQPVPRSAGRRARVLSRPAGRLGAALAGPTLGSAPVTVPCTLHSSCALTVCCTLLLLPVAWACR